MFHAALAVGFQTDPEKALYLYEQRPCINDPDFMNGLITAVLVQDSEYVDLKPSRSNSMRHQECNLLQLQRGILTAYWSAEAKQLANSMSRNLIPGINLRLL